MTPNRACPEGRRRPTRLTPTPLQRRSRMRSCGQRHYPSSSFEVPPSPGAALDEGAGGVGTPLAPHRSTDAPRARSDAPSCPEPSQPQLFSAATFLGRNLLGRNLLGRPASSSAPSRGWEPGLFQVEVVLYRPQRGYPDTALVSKGQQRLALQGDEVAPDDHLGLRGRFDVGFGALGIGC